MTTYGARVTAAPSETIRNHAAFIWSVADLLRGDYKQSEYGRVILPFVVLRRLDCVLEPSKDKVLATAARLAGRVANVEPMLRQAAGQQFYNTHRLTMQTLLDDPPNLADNLNAYVREFSSGARDVLEKFDLAAQIDRLDRANLLYLVVSRFTELDLHPDAVSNLEMGYLYEELVRRFSELSNETAGEHFTPREVIRLMVKLLFLDDDAALTRPGVVKSLLDPACGTGGMLSVAEDELRSHNPAARLEVFAKSHDVPTLASTGFIALRPGPDVDDRFVRYWLGSEPVRQVLTGATISVTRSQQRANPEVLTKSWVKFPCRDTQTKIADYVDTETARIDALIGKKRQLIYCLQTRLDVMAAGGSAQLSGADILAASVAE
jgi:type I restriction enzyme M protein